jgi:hypothetical protein
MGPVSLIVAALAAGAVKDVGETAAAAVRDAYGSLRSAVAARFAGRPTAECVLLEHANDPNRYDKPLAREVAAGGADTDPRIMRLAQELMALPDRAGTAGGKYRVDPGWRLRRAGQRREHADPHRPLRGNASGPSGEHGWYAAA